MRHGMAPREACLDALQRVSRNYNGDRERLGKFGLNFYALRKDGVYCAASLWSGRSGQAKPVFAVNDGSGSRHEEMAFLHQR
jgi:hypothetical protein